MYISFFMSGLMNWHEQMVLRWECERDIWQTVKMNNVIFVLVIRNNNHNQGYTAEREEEKKNTRQKGIYCLSV